MRLKTVALASAFLALVTGSSALAANVPATVVGASSSYPGYSADFAVDAAPNTDWASNGGGVGSYIDFDLGAPTQLSGFTLVDRVTSGGGNGAFVGGLSDFTTGFTLASYSDAAFTQETGSQAYSKSTPTSTSSASDFQFTGASSLEGQYIRYLVTATQGSNPGLENISFDASDAVSAAPEPGVWALMFAGVAMMGIALRAGRRRPLLLES